MKIGNYDVTFGNPKRKKRLNVREYARQKQALESVPHPSFTIRDLAAEHEAYFNLYAS